MKMRSLLLLALVVSACNGTNPALPVSPSTLSESPSLLTDSSPAAIPTTTMTMEADDPGSPRDLSFEIAGEPSAETTFEADLSAAEDAVGSTLDLTKPGFARSAAGANIPTRPVMLTAAAKGKVVTFTWKKGAGGGAPITYVVVYKGLKELVDLSTTFSFDAAPGRYLVGVFARNTAGDSPLATAEVIVLGAQGNYDGTFGGVGSVTRTVGPLTCRWTITYKGAVALIMGAKGSLPGVIRVKGTHSAPRGVAIRGNVYCLPGSVSYNDGNYVIVSGTNVARTGLSMGWSTGTFSGNIVGNQVKGTLKAVYKNGPGTLVMPVTLRK